MNKTKDKTVQLANNVGLNKDDLSDVGNLLTHNDELSKEDLSELKKDSRDEAEVESMAEFEVVRSLKSKNCIKHCEFSMNTYQFLRKTIQTLKKVK